MSDDIPVLTDHPLWDKAAVLANGAEVPLRAAARWYSSLELLQGVDFEWDPLPLLRECAFGRPLDRVQAHVLIREGLLHPDGSMDPVLRNVTLAAVRGEGRHLTLDSPFTDPIDRAMAAYEHARLMLRLHLPRDQAEGFLRSDPSQNALGLLAAVDRPADENDLPPDIRDTKGFVDRLLKKAGPPAGGTSPPPPPG